MTELTMKDFVRNTTFKGAADRRAEGYGVVPAKIRFILRGPEGAITFYISTGWNLDGISTMDPYGGMVHMHTTDRNLVPSDAVLNKDCDILPGGECWGDCGALHGEELYECLLKGGDKGLWTGMLDTYHMWLSADIPDGDVMDIPVDPALGVWETTEEKKNDL